MIQIADKKPVPISDEPMDHILACHRRIEHRLEVLERAGTLLEQDPDASLAAIANSLVFLDGSGALHTADEEESIFPRLREIVSAGELAYLEQLEAEHREAERVYGLMKQSVTALRERMTPENAVEYRRLAAELRDRYCKHIASEDTVLVPLARRAIHERDLSAIRSEMRARRT